MRLNIRLTRMGPGRWELREGETILRFHKARPSGCHWAAKTPEQSSEGWAATKKEAVRAALVWMQKEAK